MKAKFKNPFADRRFDLVGLIEVLYCIVTVTIAILIPIGIFAICVLWPWAICVAIVFGLIVIPVCVGIYNAFNMIFPKKKAVK